jgi:hypothetical protein
MSLWVNFRPSLDQLFHPLARSHARIILSDLDLASMVGTALSTVRTSQRDICV